MCSDATRAIVVDGISKCYRVFDRPQDRLLQALRARVGALVGRETEPLFREFWALREVSIGISRGETVGIIGRNGSGKSTLLQAICGTLTPTSGTIRLDGRIAALLELGTGFNPEFTGRENIQMNASILGLTDEQIRQRFDDIVAFADIGDFIEQPVKTYSSGMYVRLAFAVIAHVDADILVVDEALSVGDVFFAQKCMRFLRDFQKTGTVLFVSHDASAVTSLCDRAIWLDGGQVVMDGPAKDVCEAYHASTYGHAPVRKSGGGRPEAATEGDADEGEPAAERDALADEHAMVRVFRFDLERSGFGDGSAKIVEIRLESETGTKLSHVEGGELVTLVVEAVAHQRIDQPIIGFFLKDRLGQHLFGTNTYRNEGADQVPVDRGERILAKFSFLMPYLPRGRYTVDAAIANGSYHEHTQADWTYDALALESISSTVSTGLVGIPYRAVRIVAGEKDVASMAAT